MLRIKVCGMREAENVQELIGLPISFIGFIFYEKSSRNVSQFPDEVNFNKNPLSLKIKKVGVFVDADIRFVKEKVAAHQLDYVQLHGRESVFYCEDLKKAGIKIIKAFSIDERFRFTNTEFYRFSCDYFLFDTKGKNPGGNGVTFNWDLLGKYKGTTPFFLSGGIDKDCINRIHDLKLKQLFAVDINSKFEIEPAIKDLDSIRSFVNDITKPQ